MREPPPEPCPPRIAVPSSATPDLHSPTQPFAPTRVVMAPPPASVMGGTRPDPCCAEQMAATAAQLASPHTPWNATRVQSRLPPAYDMGLLGASPSMMPPPACGINALTSLPPLDPSQPAQLGRLLASLIMPCLCSWGQHRTTADWPPELLAFGPLPALHDALITSHTYSLTLPQLVTALKERAGSYNQGKAIDMLNLKAYVRCFPLYHLRSGRTPLGRPLDVVEMRMPMPAAHMSQQMMSQHMTYQTLMHAQIQTTPAASTNRRKPAA